MDINYTGPDSLTNAALQSVAQGEWDYARALLARAIGLDHNNARAHMALAQLLLAHGEYHAGWIEYEWRNKTEQHQQEGVQFQVTSMPWNGMRMPEGRLLVIGDQGYGDVIMFARWIAEAASRVHSVIVGCSEELTPIISTVPGVSACYSRWDQIPGHAAHVRTSSLPYVLGQNVISHPRGGYVTALKRYPLPPRGSLPLVGIVWAGRSTHPHDTQRSLDRGRAASLVGGARVDWVSLQVPVDPLQGLANVCYPNLRDFGDTAAAIAGLDLVITVDTAVAHLAGALGKPCWVLLHRPSDWRWGLQGDRTRWYPSLRLFRQQKPGEWGPVIEAVKLALQAEFSGCP